jgi:Deacetylase PdaC/Protein of unknown function (DUF3298)
MKLLNKYQPVLILLALSFFACSQHQGNMNAVAHNNGKQSSESKNQNSQPTVPSPAITPTPELEVTFGKGLKIVPKEVKLENQKRRYKIDVTYPQIEGTKHPRILSLNNKIRRLVAEQYRWLLNSTEPLTHSLYKNPDVNNSVDLSYEISTATDELLSIYFEVYSYGVGAAHSVQHSFTVNYDFRSDRLLELVDIFKPNENHLKFISQYCIDDLAKRHGADKFLSKDDLAPKAKNYQSWDITKEGVRVHFDACTVFACAEGKQIVDIPFTVLKDKLNPDSSIILYAK